MSTYEEPGSDILPQVIPTSVIAEPSTIAPGDDFVVVVASEIIGALPAQDVQVTITPWLLGLGAGNPPVPNFTSLGGNPWDGNAHNPSHTTDHGNGHNKSKKQARFTANVVFRNQDILLVAHTLAGDFTTTV